MPIVGPDLTRARVTSVHELSTDKTVQKHLEQLHFLAMAVCPDCLVRRRDQRPDIVLIYEAPERQSTTGGRRDKNLLTVWPSKRSVDVRVMWPKPSPKRQRFTPAELPDLCKRMSGLYFHMLAKTRSLSSHDVGS